MHQELIIRKMKEEEIPIVMDWVRKEGWNPGLNDGKCFYRADPQGFFITLLDGEPIATGSAIVYDDHFAFCGLYIVKEAFRGHGFGIQLTYERLKYADNRITGIDGVINNVSKYQRIGYVPAHKSIRYELATLKSFTSSSNIVDLKTIPFEQVEKFDGRCFPAPRSNFLRCWIAQPESYSLAYVDKELQGYGVIRKCIKGYKIGPLFAATPAIAQALFEALCSKIQEGPIYLDIPEPNQNAQTLVKYYGMFPTFEVMRMYRNGMPQLDLQGIYGFTSFELG